MAGPAETDRPGEHPAAERREAPATRIDIDPDPRRLRESIALLDDALRELEGEPARRVRLLVSEIVARSAGARDRPRGSIRLEIKISASRVRIEVSGPTLVTPSETGARDQEAEALFPHWAIDGLADRWGLDRRTRVPAMWFEVRRA